ncbi:hypothetical protein [Planococcus lenghuensis]|uniref:Uncharacterized protein n=1 Tax=Planococcus lenghuensis TaxID=2213202 RepID=A0A1Q2L2V3_9BACL|nr:hypothetical protein [Planococcus lenghuensis]AQQ54743.1 hypothetical protein B0X71_17630 [Planococcus lenghuensis]
MSEQSASQTTSRYYFSRVKDVHLENGQAFITLFARLTIETPEESKCVWVDLEEELWDHADRKLQNAPNGIYTYQITEEVFRELERLSGHRRYDLYSLTPLYKAVTFRRLAPNRDAAAKKRAMGGEWLLNN